MTTHAMVFGDDRSVSADLAWLWISSHSWPGWEVDIVTATPPAAVIASDVPVELQEWSPSNPRTIFRESMIDRVVHLTAEIDPRLALSRPASLLVIGPRGPGLAKALHLGSTAEWLLVHPPAPLVVVRHGHRTRTAVICHDGSVHADAAVSALCALPWAGQLMMTVVVVDDGRTEVEGALAGAIAALMATGATVEHRLLRGEPTEEIGRFLDSHNPDLMVCGTRGLTGLRRLHVGSTASALVHSTDSTVLVACADGDELSDRMSP